MTPATISAITMDSDNGNMSDDGFDDDFDDGDDDDIMFDGDTNEPEVSPEFLSTAEVWDELSKEVDTLISVTGLSHDVALMVMMQSRWNVEDAVSKATENLDAVVAAAGGSIDRGPHMKVEPMGECLVCMDDGRLQALHCGHFACDACWKGHIEAQMASKTTRMTCIGTDCYATVPCTRVEEFLSVDSFPKYTNALCDTYITCKNNLKWCPTPDCETVVKAEYGGAVTCRRCDEPFCFQCGYEHAPASCKDMKEFLEKNSDISKDVLWLSNNAKECPRCHSYIQKEGGCNWMKCMQCSYEFCWLCLKAIKHSEIDAAGGSHRCNTYNGTVVPETTTPTDAHGVSSEHEQRRRLAHFLQRYGAHKQSADLEHQAQRRQNTVMLRARDAYKMLVASQVVATRRLRTARQTLCSSYVFGYFQVWDESTCAKSIFEDLQHLLESRTEALSHAVESSTAFLLKNADEAKPDAEVLLIRDGLMRNTAAVETNQKNLIDSCQEGTLSAGT